MKKILLSLLITLGGVLSVQAQTQTITGIITDANNQPLPDIAVFYYGGLAQHGGYVNWSAIQPLEYGSIQRFVYTDSNGTYTIPTQNSLSFDTLLVGVVDCQGDLHLGSRAFSPNNTNGVIDIQIPCTPDVCDVVLREDPGSFTGWVFSAVPLMYSASLADFLWSYNNISRQSGAAGWALSQGYPDTLYIPSATRPQNVCYTHIIGCTPVCLDTTLTCTANYFVDTVNSLNYQGQIILWENSSTDPNATIVSYVWDFGDGSMASGQYPSHTYQDTGVYWVCLTIQSILQTAAGIDTCTDTFCDSVGFDANGNLIYKTGQQGFTINVLDPAQVGEQEYNLQDKFSLYPNPSQGRVHLNWEEGLKVSTVEVLSINGQLMRSISPEQPNALDVEGLQSGVYILRATSDKGVITMRLLVE